MKWAPAVAGASPTRAEITAGTILTTDINTIGGFKLKNSPITTPDLSTTFDTQIDGPDSVDTSTLNFYDQDNSSTIRTALAKGTAGFLLLFPYGDIVGKRVEKWACKSTGVNDEWTLDATAAKFEVGFAVTSVPVQNGTTPA
jgi:hypothetical protein